MSTYKIIAKKLRTKTYRAVGSVLNRNKPRAIKERGKDFKNIPCHRVVKSNGEIGGYAKGAEKKIEILKKEGIKILNGKIENFNRYLYKFSKGLTNF